MNQQFDIRTFDDLERFYGGARGMQQRFGMSQPGIACWKIRGIPPGYHLRIYLEARAAGLTIDPELFGLPAPLSHYLNSDFSPLPAAAQ